MDNWNDTLCVGLCMIKQYIHALSAFLTRKNNNLSGSLINVVIRITQFSGIHMYHFLYNRYFPFLHVQISPSKRTQFSGTQAHQKIANDGQKARFVFFVV